MAEHILQYHPPLLRRRAKSASPRSGRYHPKVVYECIDCGPRKSNDHPVKIVVYKPNGEVADVVECRQYSHVGFLCEHFAGKLLICPNRCMFLYKDKKLDVAQPAADAFLWKQEVAVTLIVTAPLCECCNKYGQREEGGVDTWSHPRDTAEGCGFGDFRDAGWRGIRYWQLLVGRLVHNLTTSLCGQALPAGPGSVTLHPFLALGLTDTVGEEPGTALARLRQLAQACASRLCRLAQALSHWHWLARLFLARFCQLAASEGR